MSDRRLAELRRHAPGDERARLALQRGLVRAGRSVGEAWSDLPLEVASVDDPRLTDDGRASLSEDLWNLAAERFVRHFPRDEAGRPQRLALPLLLAEYPTREPLGPRRGLWLEARTPKSGAEPARITLALTPRVGVHHARSWADLRCLWDLRVDLTEARLWGAEGVLDLVRAGSLDGLRFDVTAELIARAVLLLDAGHVLEALALFDVQVDDRVASLLAGITTPNGRAAWPEAIRAALLNCAVWRLPALLEREQARLTAWRAEKAGRPRKRAWLTLLTLPGQTESSKLSLVLARNFRRELRLGLERTGSKARCPEDLWRQPARVDVEPQAPDAEPAPRSADELRLGRQVEVLKAIKLPGLQTIIRREGLDVPALPYLHQVRESILRADGFSIGRALDHLDKPALRRICRALRLEVRQSHKQSLCAAIRGYVG